MATRPDILTETINASYTKIYTSESIRHELSDHYTFDLPGAQFMSGGRYSKHRKGSWDGKIRLYDKRNSILPTGLLRSLREEFGKPRGYTTDIDGGGGCGVHKLSHPTSISRDSLKSFIDELDIRAADGTRITCREDQLDAIIYSLHERRALVLSPTASGKTLIGYIIYQWMRSHSPGLAGLVIVPRIQLVNQLIGDWCVFSKSVGPRYALEESHFYPVYGGRVPPGVNIGKHLVVSTWQSLYKLPPDQFARYTFVLGDEAHEFRAKSLSHIMNSCINATTRIGLTGTLDGTHTHRLVLEGLFGPAKKIISSRELMDKGHIAKLHPIKVMMLKHSLSQCKLLKKGEGTYEEELGFLLASEPRNRFISNLALSLKGNTLVLFQRVETHGKILSDMMMAAAPTRKIFFIHGGVDTDIREEVRRIVESASKRIILEFGDIVIKVDPDRDVFLSSGLVKKAKDISINDDIDTSCILNNK